MKKLFSRAVGLAALLCISLTIFSQGRRGAVPFLAGAELKIRSLDEAYNRSYREKSMVEVRLVYYRDCQQAQGRNGRNSNAGDPQLVIFYSPSCCEVIIDTVRLNLDLSDRDASPICPYNSIQTTCTDLTSANPGYRTEVYIDTLELPCRAADWRVAHLHSTDLFRQNFLLSSQQIAGIGNVAAQNPALWPRYIARIQGINTQSQLNDVTEAAFYIEIFYNNKIEDGWDRRVSPPQQMYKTNTTPLSTANPLVMQCDQVQRVYNLGYYDIDGHTLRFEKLTPYKDAPANFFTSSTPTKLIYNGGFSELNPLGGTSIYNLDSNTGELDFTCQSGVGKYKTGIKIKELESTGGKVVGEVMRDIVVTIVNTPNCDNSFSVATNSFFIPNSLADFKECAPLANTSKTVEACPNSKIEFSIKAYSMSPDPNASLVVDAEFPDILSQTGAYVTSPYKNNIFPIYDTATATLHWNIPDSAPAGLYPVVFRIRDCVDGYILSRTEVVNVRVNKPAKINWLYLGYTPVLTKDFLTLPTTKISYSCGPDMTIQMIAESTDKNAQYQWNAKSSGISFSDDTGSYSSIMLNNGQIDQDQLVELVSNQYCMNRDTLLIKAKQPISPSLKVVAPDHCFNAVMDMEVINLPSVNGLFFDWQAQSKSVFETDPNFLSNTAKGILTQPINTYVVYVITPDTCIYPLVANEQISGIKPRTSYFTDKEYVCPMDTIQASAILTTSICGQSQFSLPKGNIQTIDYPGNQANIAPTPKIFTAANTIDKSRTAILYRGQELAAKGFKPGLVKSIGFDIQGIQAPNIYNNIRIRVKCTDKNDLSDFRFEDTADISDPLNFGKADKMIFLGDYPSQTLVVGWNEFSFGSGGFTWDGESNIIFDIQTYCNFAGQGVTASPPVFSDNMTNYVSIIGQYGRGYNDFRTNPIVGSNLRPNLRFNYYDLDETNLQFSWLDLSTKPNLSTVSNPTISNPKIASEVSRTLEIVTKNGNCETRDTLIAKIDSNFKINVQPDLVYKCPNDTIHVSTTLGIPKTNPIQLVCGFGNSPKDSCRKYDKTYYPVFGNTGSTAGTALQSPFGGVANIAGSPTTDKRIQMLYPYSELISNPNMQSGYISRIMFDVTNRSNNLGGLLNFTVRMKCTPKSLDSLNSDNFENINNFEEVYTAASFITVLGSNYIDLTTPFAWDGNSGLMIDICFNNFAGTNYNADIVRATNQGRRRIISMASNNGIDDGCSYITGSRDIIRPNIEFTICKPTPPAPPTPRDVRWAPTSFISNTIIQNPIIYNPFTTPYFVILDYVDTNYGMNRTVCTVRDTLFSNVNQLKIEFEPLPAVSCQGGSTIVSAGVVGMNKNLFNYEWDSSTHGIDVSRIHNPTQNISPPNPGYYYLTVTSASNPNCYTKDSVYVYIQNKKAMPDLGGHALICPGQSVTIALPSQLGYRNPIWYYNGTYYDTGYSVQANLAGKYYVEVDSGACRNKSLTKLIEFRIQDTVRLLGNDFKICEGEEAIISYNTGSGVANPLWNTGEISSSITVNQAGHYFLVNPKDQYGCLMIGKDTAIVSIIDNPDFKILDDTLCLSANEKVVLTPNPYDPAATYFWEPSGVMSPSLEVATPNTYKVTRKKGTCVKEAQAVVTKDQIGIVDLGKDRAVCCDETIILDANVLGKNYTNYKWSSGEKSQLVQTTPNTSGIYIVEAIKPNGCKDTGSIFIDNKCAKLNAYSANKEIQLGQTNPLLAKHDQIKATSINYQWIPSQEYNKLLNPDKLNSISRPRDTGDAEYILVMTVMDSQYMPPKLYCVENSVVRFKVLPNSVSTFNAFSPNGDGLNDLFYPEIRGIVKINDFKIYNRFGQLLHNDPTRPWDGKYSGTDQPSGAYLALLSYELLEPIDKSQKKLSQIVVSLVR